MILPGILIISCLLSSGATISPEERHFFTVQNLTIFGSIVSIIGFFLTIFVLYDTRRLRSFYKFRARGPTLVAELRRCSRTIAGYLNDFDAFIPQVSEELTRSAAKLTFLEKKLRGPSRASVKRLRKRIITVKVDAGSENQVREIYLEMVKVIEEMRNYERDLSWER